MCRTATTSGSGEEIALRADNPELMAELEGKVRRALGMGGPELTVIEGGEAAVNSKKRT